MINKIDRTSATVTNNGKQNAVWRNDFNVIAFFVACLFKFVHRIFDASEPRLCSPKISQACPNFISP